MLFSYRKGLEFENFGVGRSPHYTVPPPAGLSSLLQVLTTQGQINCNDLINHTHVWEGGLRLTDSASLAMGRARPNNKRRVIRYHWPILWTSVWNDTVKMHCYCSNSLILLEKKWQHSQQTYPVCACDINEHHLDNITAWWMSAAADKSHCWWWSKRLKVEKSWMNNITMCLFNR